MKKPKTNRRPQIIRTPRVNGMVLRREEVAAFVRLRFKKREKKCESMTE